VLLRLPVSKAVTTLCAGRWVNVSVYNADIYDWSGVEGRILRGDLILAGGCGDPDIVCRSFGAIGRLR
jgi:hypothetical protein